MNTTFAEPNEEEIVEPTPDDPRPEAETEEPTETPEAE